MSKPAIVAIAVVTSLAYVNMWGAIQTDVFQFF